MNNEQVWAIAGSFAILILVTLAAQFRWLPSNGRVYAAIVLVAGIGVVAALWYADIPPNWFDGSKSAFLLALSLAVSAFVGGDAGREFRRPLLLGMGGTLLVLNVLAHV